LNELLRLFRINLHPDCADYRKTAMALMRSWVRALQDISARQRGEPIESPPMPDTEKTAPTSGRSLRAAYDGWVKMQERPQGTLLEFSRGITRFIELHVFSTWRKSIAGMSVPSAKQPNWSQSTAPGSSGR
jgi:hypothetical protein